MWGADTRRAFAERRGTRRIWHFALALCALLTLSLAGCSLPALPFTQTTITGRVLGVAVAARQLGQTVAIPLSATVRCGTVRTTTAADGSYRLSVSDAKQYTCTATGPTGYAPAIATIPGTVGSTITLDFDSATATACTAPTARGTLSCPLLALEPGTLAGTVETQNGLPVAEATITCQDIYGQQTTPGAQPPVYAGTASATGAFNIASLPVGTYGCIATSQSGVTTFRQIPVAPSATADDGFTMCSSGCQRVTYHDGPVMHAQHVYLIYWMPKGYSLDASGNAHFEATIARYFHDIAGTPFYDLIQQYYDYQGAPSDSVILAGTTTDTTAFAHCSSLTAPTNCTHAAATIRDPLYDVDIQAEISRVLTTEGWQPAPTNVFFVLLPTAAQECEDSSADSNCTYLKQDAADCGYHNSFQPGADQNVIYALIADANTTPGACVNSVEYAPTATISPNGNWALDAEISTISHEQFESATDPINIPSLGGWYDDSSGAGASGGDEIADLCQNDFPAPNANGANAILHGDGYFLQAMWSDSARGCALP